MQSVWPAGRDQHIDQQPPMSDGVRKCLRCGEHSQLLDPGHVCSLDKISAIPGCPGSTIGEVTTRPTRIMFGMTGPRALRDDRDDVLAYASIELHGDVHFPDARAWWEAGTRLLSGSSARAIPARTIPALIDHWVDDKTRWTLRANPVTGWYTTTACVADDGPLYLARHRAPGRGLPPIFAARIGLRVSQALASVHASGLGLPGGGPFVHGAVSLWCLQIRADGWPRLNGFGGVAVRASGNVSTDIEVYRAVEAVQRQQHNARPTTEVLRVGLLLHHLLAGRVPRPDDATRGIPAHEIAPIPRELSDVVATACAPRPRDRYPSIAALRDALTAAIRRCAPQRSRLDALCDAASGPDAAIADVLGATDEPLTPPEEDAIEPLIRRLEDGLSGACALPAFADMLVAFSSRARRVAYEAARSADATTFDNGHALLATAGDERAGPLLLDAVNAGRVLWMWRFPWWAIGAAPLAVREDSLRGALVRCPHPWSMGGPSAWTELGLRRHCPACGVGVLVLDNARAWTERTATLRTEDPPSSVATVRVGRETTQIPTWWPLLWIGDEGAPLRCSGLDPAYWRQLIPLPADRIAVRRCGSSPLGEVGGTIEVLSATRPALDIGPIRLALRDGTLTVDCEQGNRIQLASAR